MENPFEQYDAEENKKAYELQQKQRTMERRIRDTKRQTMGWKEAMDMETDPVKKSMFEAEYQRKTALLQRQNAAYNQYCKDNGLKKQSDRISFAKWDRQQAAMARGAAAKNTQKSVANSQNSGNIKLPDVVFGRSLGAKAKNYEVMDLETGEKFYFVEGTKLQDVEVFAGKGASTPYRKAYKYAERIGGKTEDWQHVKGKGWVATAEGDLFAEVHWSQCEGFGKHDFFVKRWLD